MPVPFLIGAGLLSLYQTIKGQSELNKLHKQKVAEFSEDPEMAASRSRANQLARGGFTGAEKAAFRQNVAQDINTQSQRMKDIGGGNLARTISGLGKINTIGAENQLASQDAALHRQNIHYADKFSQQLQNVRNANTQESLKQRYAAEQSLGNAVQSGLTGLASTANLAQITNGFGAFGKTAQTAGGAPPFSQAAQAPTATELGTKYSTGIGSLYGSPFFNRGNSSNYVTDPNAGGIPYNMNQFGIPSEYR